MKLTEQVKLTILKECFLCTLLIAFGSYLFPKLFRLSVLEEYDLMVSSAQNYWAYDFGDGISRTLVPLQASLCSNGCVLSDVCRICVLQEFRSLRESQSGA